MTRWSVGRVRNFALDLLDRSPRAGRVIRATAVQVARRLGADPEILAEAADRNRPLNRSLQIVQWATAAAGTGSFPRHFAPGEHLRDPEARAAAARSLRTADPVSATAERHLIGLEDDVDATLRAIEQDLSRAIRTAARLPKRGTGLEPDQQLEVVADAMSALSRPGIRPFLMSGSLLGLIRDGDFMQHDHDIDLGLLPGEDVDAAIDALTASGTFDVEEAGPRIVALHSNGISADVFPHTVRGGLFWHSTKIHEWWNTPFGLEERHLRGSTLWIPDAPERYLHENYGHWEQPIPFYDMSFDTPNRRYLDDLDAARFLHSRCVRALETGDRWLFESAARELRDTFGVDVTDSLADSPLLDVRPERLGQFVEPRSVRLSDS